MKLNRLVTKKIVITTEAEDLIELLELHSGADKPLVVKSRLEVPRFYPDKDGTADGYVPVPYVRLVYEIFIEQEIKEDE